MTENSPTAEITGMPDAGVSNLRLADRVYLSLKAMIIRGDLKPGQKLTSRLLSTMVPVSATPLREALNALTAEGFIAQIPYRGMRIAPLTPKLLSEIFDVRKALEWLAIGEVAAHATPSDIAALREIIDAGERHLARGDREGYREADLRFHLELARLSGNAELQRLINNHVDKIRWLMSFSSRTPRVEYAQTQHFKLLDLIAQHKVAEAQAAIVRHIEEAKRDLLKGVPLQDQEQDGGSKHKATG